MNANPSNPFARLWHLGYRRLVPIVPPGVEISERSSLYKRIQAGRDDRGKTPGVRWPDGRWSGFDWIPHDADEPDLTRWHSMGAGVGIKTGDLGDGTSLVLIDADTLDEQHAATIKDALETMLGKLPVRIGKYPKAGYLARLQGVFRYSRVEFGDRTNDRGQLLDRVEILSDGRQFVAEGIHPGTMQPYRWPDGVPALAELPVIQEGKVEDFLVKLVDILPKASPVKMEGASAKHVDQSVLRGDPEMIRRAVEATPNTSEIFPTREAWRDFGYAIKAAMGPDHEAEALELFTDWSIRWEDDPKGVGNDPGQVEAEWRRFKPPFKRGANWLYEQAEETSEGKFSRAQMWFEPPQEPLFPAPLPSENLSKSFKFTSFQEAASSALTLSTKPLIKGMLDQGAMSVLYGESNVGKTFVAMDVAAHVAAAMDWGGMRTTGHAVVYVAAEGGVGARRRAAAIQARHPGVDFTRFLFLLHPINLLRADADLAPLIASIAAIGQPVGLIVIDTLSRAMAGGDENASTDMGAMVKHLDALRTATGAHLMVVHHSGKDRAKGARGHSLLRAATDTEIEIAEGELRVTKQRDLEKSFCSRFALPVVTLGVDEEGDPITSCTVRLLRDGEEIADAPPAQATAKEREVLDALARLEAGADAVGETWKGATSADLSRALFAAGTPMLPETVRFHSKSLISKRLAEKGERGKISTITSNSRKSLRTNRRECDPPVSMSGQSVFE